MSNFQQLDIIFKPRPGCEGPEVHTQYYKSLNEEKESLERFQGIVLGALRQAIATAAKLPSNVASQMGISLALPLVDMNLVGVSDLGLYDRVCMGFECATADDFKRIFPSGNYE